MPDRELTIKSLEIVYDRMRKAFSWYEEAQAVEDALALLWEQEPVKPIKPNGSASWICGACRKAIGTSLIYHFCPWCGKEVKRNA